MYQYVPVHTVTIFDLDLLHMVFFFALDSRVCHGCTPIWKCVPALGNIKALQPDRKTLNYSTHYMMVCTMFRKCPFGIYRYMMFWYIPVCTGMYRYVPNHLFLSRWWEFQLARNKAGQDEQACTSHKRSCTENNSINLNNHYEVSYTKNNSINDL
jgi:hypothetical protein